MGFFKKKLKIKVKYRDQWYHASSIFINEEGDLSIEYCHDLTGCVDSEHVHNIIIENDVSSTLCECGHDKDEHFGMTEEGAFCHWKNEEGNYGCDCKTFLEDTKSVPDVKEALMKEAMGVSNGDQDKAIELLFSDWIPTYKYMEDAKSEPPRIKLDSPNMDVQREIDRPKMSEAELNRRRMVAMNGGNPYDVSLKDSEASKNIIKVVGGNKEPFDISHFDSLDTKCENCGESKKDHEYCSEGKITKEGLYCNKRPAWKDNVALGSHTLKTFREDRQSVVKEKKQ